MTFKCTNSVGATLLLRASAARVDFDDSDVVHEYISRHVDSWYEYLRNRRRYGETQAPEGSLVLIKGCDKTSSWAHAAFAERSKEASVFFNGGFVKDTFGGAIKINGSWARSLSAVCREAPLSTPSNFTQPLAPVSNDTMVPSSFPPDCVYSVFTRIYKFKRRPGIGPFRRTVGITVGGRKSTIKLPQSKVRLRFSQNITSD
jgi:hypothetical protein